MRECVCVGGGGVPTYSYVSYDSPTISYKASVDNLQQSFALRATFGQHVLHEPSLFNCQPKGKHRGQFINYVNGGKWKMCTDFHFYFHLHFAVAFPIFIHCPSAARDSQEMRLRRNPKEVNEGTERLQGYMDLKTLYLKAI